MVITPGPITDYTHVQISPLGWPVIAWEKDATEEAGLVKIDLLGNRSLAVLRDTLGLVERNHAVRLEWESFDPLSDPDTRDLIAGGKTLGVFYVESPATRQLLTKMQKGDYENLVIASSIIRPAANQYIRTFVKRLHGAPYRPLHPLIEKTLAETFGVMVYQEDVSRVAIDLAGFPIEEADRLRKILSKKDRALKLPDFREKFFRGARARGVREETIVKIWDMILSFDGYSFCKAHSASYAQVSYRVAYLKRFYPLEFIASVINNSGGFYGRQTYVDECRRMGFPILPPDVNRSRWEYTVEDGGLSASAQAGLRVGLGQLKDARQELVEAIIAERERRGEFRGFRDFLQRAPCRFEDIRILIRSGALDSVSDGYTRPQLFFRWLNLEKEEGLGFLPPVPPLIGDYPSRVRLADEVKTLGIVVSRHPLELFRQRIDRIVSRHRLSPFIGSSAIPEFRGRKVWTAGDPCDGKRGGHEETRAHDFRELRGRAGHFRDGAFPRRVPALLPPAGRRVGLSHLRQGGGRPGGAGHQRRKARAGLPPDRGTRRGGGGGRGCAGGSGEAACVHVGQGTRRGTPRISWRCGLVVNRRSRRTPAAPPFSHDSINIGENAGICTEGANSVENTMSRICSVPAYPLNTTG